MKKIIELSFLGAALTSIETHAIDLAKITDSTINQAIGYNNQISKIIASEGSNFGRSCAAILQSGLIYDKERKLSSRYNVERYYDFISKSDFQSASQMQDISAKLGIPIEGLPTPLDLSTVLSSKNFKESLQQWLSTAWSYLSDQTTFEEFSEKISDKMTDAFKACIESEKEIILKKNGTFVYVTPEDDYLRKYTVTLEIRPPSFDYKPIITSIGGSDIECKLGGQPFKTPYEMDTSTLTINCTKFTDESRVLAINAKPTGSSTPVSLPGLSDGIIMDLKQRTRGLAQSIEKDRRANQERYNKLGVSDKSLDNRMPLVGGNAKLWTAESLCPEGQYVAGIVAKDHDGGGYCYDCMSQVGVICRPFSVNK